MLSVNPGTRRSPAIGTAPYRDIRSDKTTEYQATVAPTDETAAKSSAPPETGVVPVADVRPVASTTHEPAANVALLNMGTLVRASWSHRSLILVLMLVFAVVCGVLAPMIPRKYTAQTNIYFDPRQIEFSNANAQSNTSSDVIVSMINSQAKVLTSPSAVGKVVERLKLTENPMFSSASGELSSRTSSIISTIQRSATVELEPSSYVVTLSVTTADGTVSAEIANALVDAFLEEENQAYSSIYERTNSALDSRLRELSQEVQQAEEAVETYKANNGMVTADGNLIDDKRLVQLNDLLITAQKATIEAKSRVDTAENFKLEDAISANGAQQQVSSGLTDLRQQYAQRAAAVGSLESALGARHPQLVAAKASLQTLQQEIAAELQRNLARARADLAQAQQSEQQVSKELAVQKALQNNTQQRQVSLNDLQRRATAAREIYEAVLKRVRETSEEQNVARSNIRVLSEATVPRNADGPGRSVLLVAGVVAGCILGLGIGLFIALARTLSRSPQLRAYFLKLKEGA